MQERWFKTLQVKLISHLDGFSDQYRGKTKAAKKCIPFPLLQKLIDDFMLEYHLTEHSELKMTPWEYWHRGLADAHGLVVPTEEIDRCLRISRDVQVTPEGLHVDNRRFISPCLEGRVGDTLTVRIPPEGPKDSVTVFDHGLPLGTAVEHISTELAEVISKTRLERTIAIDALAKRIREKNEQTPLTDVPSQSPGPKSRRSPCRLHQRRLMVIRQSRKTRWGLFPNCRRKARLHECARINPHASIHPSIGKTGQALPRVGHYRRGGQGGIRRGDSTEFDYPLPLPN